MVLPLTQYLGLDLLDIGLDVTDRPADRYGARIEVLGSPFGARFYDFRAPAPRWNRTIRWRTFSRDEALDLKNFLDARKGRLVPFWLPSGEADLTPSYNWGAGGATQGRISKVGYADSVYPLGNVRRHLRILSRDSAWPGAFYRKVTSAVSFDADEDVIGWDPLEPVPAGHRPFLSYLRLMRLESDVNRIEWTGTANALCDLPLVELPREYP